MNNLPWLTTQFFWVLMMVTLIGCSQGEKKPMFTDTDKSKFKVGQVWNYQTRTNDVGSTLVILKVETGPGWKTIVHVGIAGLNIKTPKGTQDAVPHMPFDEAAMTKSVTTKVADNGMLTHFQEGYGLWRDAASSGKGGVFTITVAEAVATVEAGLNKVQPR